MSYSVTGGGVQTAVAALQPHSCSIPNTPDVINSIMSLMDPFQPFSGNASLTSEDSSASICSPVSTCSPVSACSPLSTRSPVSTCSPVSPTARMQNICSSLKIKEELKMAIRSKQKNAVTATVTSTCASRSPVQTNRSNTSGACGINVAATASAGLAASSPGGGQARKRRIQDEESHGDDDYDDDDGDDVSSHGEGESNVLETKNYDLKSQIHELETQRNELMKMLSAHPCAKRHPHQHQQQQHHHQQHQSQHQQQLQEQYTVEPYANDPYRQHGHVAVDPPVLKDTMFSGGSNYVPVPSVANQPADVYHRPITTTAASMSTAHYPIVGAGSVGNVYTSCVDELYDYNKDLISGGGPPDLSHQYYDHGIC
ncbi:pyrroline-5-carboxylate reductase 1 isoform X2 [Aphis gossypii]|uniref:pyrroline-5-carboxylate reductase 1 isoform X2 n=1 Tax=Aphis gossypii TaxID=80765 RepID=UPI0021591A40|nr:pyrroline-5-carboxylate reductase 1 isoform X2 [Aphis gossypii]